MGGFKPWISSPFSFSFITRSILYLLIIYYLIMDNYKRSGNEREIKLYSIFFFEIDQSMLLKVGKVNNKKITQN